MMSRSSLSAVSIRTAAIIAGASIEATVTACAPPLVLPVSIFGSAGRLLFDITVHHP